MQMFVVSRVIKFLGVGKALFIHPMVALSGYLLMLRAPSMTTMTYVKVADNSLDYSLGNTTKQALWLPTSREAKYKAKQAVDSFFVRAGDVMQAGLVFTGERLALRGAGVRRHQRRAGRRLARHRRAAQSANAQGFGFCFGKGSVMNSIVVLLLTLVTAQAPPIGKADSTFDKKANFASFRTYAWTPGTHAFNPAAHKMILEAVEAEMAARGFTKVDIRRRRHAVVLHDGRHQRGSEGTGQGRALRRCGADQRSRQADCGDAQPGAPASLDGRHARVPSSPISKNSARRSRP